MDALIFVAVCCGFLPRSAMESGDVSIPRIDRIHSALRGSRYSVHDLARCQGEGPADLARFNMPLELGVAMGLGQAHDWVALVPDQHPYARFVSDLAGFDLRRYDSSEAGLVMAVMPWLATRPDAIKTPTPAQVMDALTEFRSELGELRSAWLGEPPWVDVVQAAIGVAQYRWDEWTLGPSVSVRAAASGRLESA
jgi:hypothetical protein